MPRRNIISARAHFTILVNASSEDKLAVLYLQASYLVLIELKCFDKFVSYFSTAKKVSILRLQHAVFEINLKY